MTSRLQALCFDAQAPLVLARFWSGLLGWEVAEGRPYGAALLPGDDTGFELRFLTSDAPKPGKNRMHFDVVGDTSALMAAGATLIRPRDEDTEPDDAIEWDVLADPEGNEFCVFSPE